MEFTQSVNGESFLPRLDAGPRIHFANWRIAVRELASSLGTAYYPTNGWMSVGILVTEQQWKAEHENQARPFPKERQMPPISEKKPAAFARYKANQVKLTKFHDDLRNLKDQMLRSLGADIKDSLRDPTEGFAQLDPADILAKITEQYGRLTDSDIAEIRIQAAEEITNSRALPGKVTKMRQRFNQLEHAGEPLPEGEKMQILAAAVSKFPAASNCIIAYKQLVPDREDRRFSDMSAYLIKHINIYEHSITVTEAGFAAAVAAKVEEAVQRELGLSKQATAASIKEVQPVQRQRREKRPRQQEGSGIEAVSTTPDKYCWRCGFNPTHNGPQCFIMQRDASNTYTAHMITAKNPHVIPGKKGNDSVQQPRKQK